jgi:hypothetical protein
MGKIRGKAFPFIIVSLIVLFAMIGGTWTTASAAAPNPIMAAQQQCPCTMPTISIVSVSADVSVTIRTANYPANDTFNVYMNYFGTRGVGGIKVDTIHSGSGGSFDKTFNIPSELKGQRMIAIRLESPTSGYFSYNWFYNASGGTIPDTGKPSQPKYYPTFSITSVDIDKTVTIKTNDYPPQDTFTVLMGQYGTKGIGGIKVDTIDSGDGGTFSKTFDIPDTLKGSYRIAIRLESASSGYYSYNWFYNKTAGTIPDTGAKPPKPFVIPTFSITGVERNSSVTIKTANFPANDTFNVLMNYYGTAGIGGTKVETVSTGEGGTLTLTFNIPDFLKGQGKIAIRLESPSSGYFSYNWFYNNTYP